MNSLPPPPFEEFSSNAGTWGLVGVRGKVFEAFEKARWCSRREGATLLPSPAPRPIPKHSPACAPRPSAPLRPPCQLPPRSDAGHASALWLDCPVGEELGGFLLRWDPPTSAKKAVCKSEITGQILTAPCHGRSHCLELPVVLEASGRRR